MVFSAPTSANARQMAAGFLLLLCAYWLGENYVHQLHAHDHASCIECLVLGGGVELPPPTPVAPPVVIGIYDVELNHYDIPAQRYETTGLAPRAPPAA